MAATLPSKQKVVEVDEFSQDRYLEHVRIVERDVPEPGKGEVLVNVYLRPVNPTDLISLKTGYAGSLPRPSVPGSEGVGRVVKLGEGTSKFTEGQRVIAIGWPLREKGTGSWAQYVVVSEEKLVSVPLGVDDETAAQLFVNPPTAFGLLKSIGAPEGEYVLQTAATSVVGRQIIALAKHWGVKTINLVRRESAVHELKALGADEVLVIGKDNIPERVKEITGGKGAYGAADAVGGKLALDVLAAIRPGGTSFVYGVLGQEPLQLDQASLLFLGKGVHGFILAQFLAKHDQHVVMAEVIQLVENKIIPVGDVGNKYPLEQVVDALKEYESSQGGKKVFLEG